MHPEIEKLINLTVASGEITEKKKAIIMRKAESLGENVDEVEMIIDGEFALLQKTPQKPTQFQSNVSSIDKSDNINYVYAFRTYINNHVMVKYALIFFLVCFGFFLFSVLVTMCI